MPAALPNGNERKKRNSENVQRVVKLERSGNFPFRSVLEHHAALEESAQRLTGEVFKSSSLDRQLADQVMEDVMSRFCRRLSHADEESAPPAIPRGRRWRR